jgi:hypothetical protein
MRKAILVVVGVGIVALTLTGCAPAVPGGGSGSGGSSSSGASADTSAAGSNDGGVPWGKPSGVAPYGAPFSGQVDVCSLLPVATVSALSGKHFTSSKNFDNPGYACVYKAGGSKPWSWTVSINFVGPAPDGPDIAIGADGGVKPLNGIAYPAVTAVDGAALQWGGEEVIVSDISTYKYSRSTAAQYVAVAEALMAAINKARGS